jgi:hypothetical protein
MNNAICCDMTPYIPVERYRRLLQLLPVPLLVLSYLLLASFSSLHLDLKNGGQYTPPKYLKILPESMASHPR